jgi:hypothetical protein
MQKAARDSSERDRRRFAFERAGQLWMSDVLHGPGVSIGDRTRRKTYLIAFIDDATRVIPYAAFALAENTRAFLPILKQAILRRGFWANDSTSTTEPTTALSTWHWSAPSSASR